MGSLFNSLSTRIPLALIGGTFYGLLIYSILCFVSFSDWALPASVLVFIPYVASRLLLLFSGIPTPYYSKGKGTLFKSLPERHPFRHKAGLVGAFYHIHDIALFIVVVIMGIGFILSFFIDGFSGQSMGTTFENLRQILLPALDRHP